MFCPEFSAQIALHHFEENILVRTNSAGPFEQIILGRTFRANHLSLIAAEDIVNVFFKRSKYSNAYIFGFSINESVEGGHLL